MSAAGPSQGANYSPSGGSVAAIAASVGVQFSRRRAVPRRELLPHGAAQRPHWPLRPQAWGSNFARGGNMPTNKRRELLQAAAALAATGVATQTRAAADTAMTIRTPFEVADTFIPIAGSAEQFPVRRIYCIGRNYAAHAREMGSDPNREPPFFFQKPTDAIQIVPPGETIDHPYPSLTKNYHYEVELVAALAKGGRNIPVDRALDHVYAYTVGLDMTRRDLQRAMGDEKKPWEIGKSFDHSKIGRASCRETAETEGGGE